MTNHTARLYVFAASILAFFVLWAAIAAHPWRSQTADPRIAALAQRERSLRREATLVQRVVSARAVAATQAKQAARARAQMIAASQTRARTAATQAAAQATASVAAAAAPAPVSQPSVRVVHLPPLVITRTS